MIKYVTLSGCLALNLYKLNVKQSKYTENLTSSQFYRTYHNIYQFYKGPKYKLLSKSLDDYDLIGNADSAKSDDIPLMKHLHGHYGIFKTRLSISDVKNCGCFKKIKNKFYNCKKRISHGLKISEVRIETEQAFN